MGTFFADCTDRDQLVDSFEHAIADEALMGGSLEARGRKLARLQAAFAEREQELIAASRGQELIAA